MLKHFFTSKPLKYTLKASGERAPEGGVLIRLLIRDARRFRLYVRHATSSVTKPSDFTDKAILTWVCVQLS
jgi:hypothetical protein